jgi:hypothetical protein
MRRAPRPLKLYSPGTKLGQNSGIQPERNRRAMAKNPKAEWIAESVRKSARAAFRQAYEQVQVDPEKYFRRIRGVYRLPIQSWEDMQRMDERVPNSIAEHVIASSKRAATLEGLGLGVGGLLTILPDMGILSAITIRMLQRLSLIYGFEYVTDREVAAFWLAAATAAGLDLGRDFLEKQAIERVAPRVIDAMAVKVGAEVAEKWAGRLIPILSAGVAATLNYYFVRSWGRRAQQHFLERHRALRTPPMDVESPRKVLLMPAPTPESP